MRVASSFVFLGRFFTNIISFSCGLIVWVARQERSTAVISTLNITTKSNLLLGLHDWPPSGPNAPSRRRTKYSASMITFLR